MYAKCQCFCLRSESWNLSAVPNLWILLVVLFFVLCKKSLLCCSCLNFREDFVGLEIESTSHHYFKFLIILMTLEYPFSLQKVLHKICTPHGKVLRIVIFHKNGLQALVEYPFQTLCTLLVKSVCLEYLKLSTKIMWKRKFRNACQRLFFIMQCSLALVKR